MKKIILSVIIVCSSIGAIAQTNLKLNLHHYWNNDVFNYGDIYEDAQGRKITISRVQYYLSSFEIEHDGTQSTAINDSYILASGNITNYSIGTANLTNLENVKFNVGIDAATNHLDPTLQASSHPLSEQSPSMHWGWTAGYRFLVIEGKVDSNDDGVPNKGFQFHVTSNDSYLRVISALTTSGDIVINDLEINLDVNIAGWLVDIDLTTAGYNHGDFPVNVSVMDNTNDHSVFTTNIGLGFENTKELKNNIFFDYELTYAPTIFYKFPNENTVALKIYDLQGRVILEVAELVNEGNFFINKELADGTYIAVFTTKKGSKESEKFIVRN